MLVAAGAAAWSRAQPAEGVPPLRSPTPPVTSNPAPTAEGPRPGLTGGIDWLAGLDASRLGVPEATVLAERTFLTRRPGWLVRTGGGSVVFVPDRDHAAAEENGDPPRPAPMRLMPSLELERIESALGDEPGPARFALTGQVYVFNGTNHLMPTAAARTSMPEPRPEPRPEPGPESEPARDTGGARRQGETGSDTAGETGGETGNEAGAQDPAPAPAAGDPAIDEIVRQIREAEGEAGLGEAANLAPDPDAGDDEAESRDRSPLPEGTYLSQRRVRLLRRPGGALEVTLDNDADTPGENGPGGEPAVAALTLLPCTLTESLAGSLELVREEPVLLISGRVYAYRGRGYLLPTIYRFESPGEVDPRQ